MPEKMPEGMPDFLATKTDQENMILVHMQKAEAHGLDAGQGGMELDEETQLRSYRKWEKMIEDPNVKELFDALMVDKTEDGDVDPPFSTEYNQIARTLPPWEPAPGDSNPVFAELAAKGRGGDDIVVWLPIPVVTYFGKLKHGLTENPETGLIEFGFWKEVGKIGKAVISPITLVRDVVKKSRGALPEIIRVGGTLAGYYFGGPIGAGLGNAAASWVTGKNVQDSAISGLKNYGLASIPGMLGMGQGAAAAGAAGGAPVVDGTGKLSAAAMSRLNAGAAGGGAGGAAQSGLLGNLGGTSGLMKLGGLGGMWALKNKSDKDAYKNALRDREQMRREQMQDLQRVGLVSSFDRANAPQYAPLEHNPDFYNRSAEDREAGRSRHSPFRLGAQKFAEGGPVKEIFSSYFKGPGKGQDDAILTKVPENTYVIDAQTTAYAGDGSTKAGAENWAQWGKEMMGKHAMIPKNKKSSAMNRVRDVGGGHVDVAVSDGEAHLAPQVVQSIGGGSHDKGAKILEAMIRNIRADKTRNRAGMPPKIKPLSAYMPRNVGGIK
jgi:hypothetical protein